MTLALLAGILVSLVIGAQPAIEKSGLGFFTNTVWDPVAGNFGGAVMIYGTIATSLIALVIAVPVSFGIAVFLTELSPAWLKRPLGTAIELLAAVPSIVYGMWGLLVFGPLLAKYVQQPLQSLQTRGMVTWTRTLIMGTQNYLYSVNIYDDKGRLIQVKSTNLQGGEDIATTQYNWAGQPLRIIAKTTIPGTGGQTGITITDISYDDLGRALKTQKKIQHSLVSSNAIPNEWTQISEQAYDALGQLKQKSLGQKRNSSGTYTTDKLNNLDYGYNVRGWLLSVNKDYTEGDNSNDQYFSLELGYDKDPSMGSSGAHQ